MSTDRSFNAPENSNHPSRRFVAPVVIGGVTYVICQVTARFNDDVHEPVFIARHRGTDGKWCDVMNGKQHLWDYTADGVAVLLEASHIVENSDVTVLSSGDTPPTLKIRARDIKFGDMLWSKMTGRFHLVERVVSDSGTTTAICHGGFISGHPNVETIEIAASRHLAMAWNVESERKANGEAA